MSFSIVEICAVSLLVGTGCIIYLERKFPYRRGIPFFREGFWTDLIGYGLIQSFFLKIVIFDYSKKDVCRCVFNPAFPWIRFQT